MLFIPEKKAKAMFKENLEIRNERRKKERKEFFRQLYGSDIDVDEIVK